MTDGTKYHPLFEHLLFSGHGRIEMSFAEIEGIIGAKLAPSARRREEWWSNNTNGHSQARAWMRANYRAFQVDLSAEKVVFQLDGWPDRYRKPNFAKAFKGALTGMGEDSQAAYAAPDGTSSDMDHPLFGIWKGKVTLLLGYDYTKPAFESDLRAIVDQLLLDTCAIIWIALNEPIKPEARAAMKSAMATNDKVRVSPISAWELGLLSSKGRLAAARSPMGIFSDVIATAGVRIEPLSPEILVDSSFLPGDLHRDPADRILIATARMLDLTLVTRDQIILDYAKQGYVRALPC